MSESKTNVIAQLRSNFGPQLYSAERRIADCILTDPAAASTLTSAQLAQRSNSSEATVTRLSHKLGYENYRKFQLALACDVLNLGLKPPLAASGEAAPVAEAVQTILGNRQDELHSTLHELDLDELTAVVESLRKADLIEVAGAGPCLPVAYDAMLKLSSLGKRCISNPILDENCSFARTLTNRDVLLLIMEGGRCAALEQATQLAQENGATVVLILRDRRRSPIVRCADHVLLLSNHEATLHDGEFMPSQVAALSLIDLLYYLLLKDIGTAK